jgi:hypothetical protein
MGYPGFDPETAVRLIRTLILLDWIACAFAAVALVALSAYFVSLCLEIFSPQPRSKARLAKVPHPLGSAPVAEEDRDPSAEETPILPDAEPVGEEAVPLPAPHDTPMPVTSVPCYSGEQTPWALGFLKLPTQRRQR